MNTLLHFLESLILSPVIVCSAYFICINIATYYAYKMDKQAARKRVWRISEKKLLWMGMLGGTPAAFYASKKLRHKNKKANFRIMMWLILLLQVALITYIAL